MTRNNILLLLAACPLLCLLGLKYYQQISPAKNKIFADLKDENSDEAVVLKVIDGDTIKTSLGIVRVKSIDCPEFEQDGGVYGVDAMLLALDLLFDKSFKPWKGKTVLLNGRCKDKYGRRLAKVYLPDGRSLAEELLRNGLAWHYKKYDQSPELALIEEMARARRVGLWKDPNPIPPWEWRKNHKK